jgi:hypothetical protein
MSVRFDCSAKDVRIVPIIVAEFELINVERKIFARNFMERSYNSPFDQRPEALYGLSMDIAVNVFAFPMMNHAMREVLIEIPIAFVVIGRNQADLMRYGFLNESVKSIAIRAVDHSCNHVSFALHGADYDALAVSASPAKVATSAFTFVFVLGFSANKRFVNFNVADHLAEFDVAERNANLAAHQMRGIVGTKAHDAVDLKGADSILAGQHHVHDPEPLAQRLVGILEDRADQNRETISLLRTHLALPMIRARFKFPNFVVATARAMHYAIWPAIFEEICFAGIFMREQLLKLRNRHLVNLQMFLSFGHGVTPINVTPL